MGEREQKVNGSKKIEGQEKKMTRQREREGEGGGGGGGGVGVISVCEPEHRLV